MRREDVIDLFRRIPPEDHPKVVVVLSMGLSINVEGLTRPEAEYMVARGREAGTNDEGRAFFIPYAEIAYVKIERLVKTGELRQMYGEAAGSEREELEMAPTPASVGADTPTPPAAALDPAAIAKQNLLERIRAARTSAGVPRR